MSYHDGSSHRTSRRSSPLPLLPSLRDSLLDRFVSRNEDVYVADIAPGLQTIHLKEEEGHKLVLHLVHLCKPHGYALELYARREAFGKLSVYEVEKISPSGRRWGWMGR